MIPPVTPPMVGPISPNISVGPPQGATQREELREAAQQFEAILLRQMLASARSTDFGGNDLFEQQDDTFLQMRDEQFAELTAKSGQIGFADAIERELARFLPQEADAPAPTPEDKA